MTDPIVTVAPSQGRRLFGVLVLGSMGLLLLYLAGGQNNGSALSQIGLFGFGALTLWGAYVMWNATARSLVLTEEGLMDDTGAAIALFDHIATIDRGMFAMKPSNGFILRLNTRAKGAWVPGLWWRWGKRVGIGGVTSANQTKVLAEAMTSMIISRLQAELQPENDQS